MRTKPTEGKAFFLSLSPFTLATQTILAEIGVLFKKRFVEITNLISKVLMSKFRLPAKAKDLSPQSPICCFDLNLTLFPITRKYL